ncbi:MAG: sugar isomerase [Planctomyces sp.]|nr:sugar isomerase [Planctomyces sp.]
MFADREPYAGFGLVADMLAVPGVIRAFDPEVVSATASEVRAAGRLLLTGEGSSRLFPGKNAIMHSRQQGWPLVLHTEAGRQAQDYALKDWAVLAASNSGKTAEVIRLFTQLKGAGHAALYSLTAMAASPLEALAKRGHVLQCGKEGAVAATKSVIEQALVVRALVEAAAGESRLKGQLPTLADQVETVLTQSIDKAIIDKLSQAGTIYFAGRNDGVGEELTLKTNEITRKRSDYLEGTYAVHGIEEIMQADDVVVWINPYAESEQKFHDVLVKGVGLTVVTISPRETMFPNIQIPDGGRLAGFVELCAGWNLLVEIGMALGVNVDKPQRARKVGNEFVAG